MKQRNIALSIVLTVVTCGIYWLYWLSCLTNDIHRLSGEKDNSFWSDGGIIQCDNLYIL